MRVREAQLNRVNLQMKCHIWIGAKGPIRNMKGPPPAITSVVLEQIKVLPEADVTLLIFSETADTTTIKMGEAMLHLASGPWLSTWKGFIWERGRLN
jgi:hypothetical protein